MGKRDQRSSTNRAFYLVAAGVGIAALLVLARTRRRSETPATLEDLTGVTFNERSAVVEGVRQRWLEHGQGTPVVLIHGIPTSPTLWRKVMPGLRHAKAHAWEMVGYGASIPQGQGRDISVGRQAEYLAALLRHLQLGRVVLVGHDLGGGVAQILAMRHPELCSGLLLVNSVGYDSWPIPEVKALRSLGPLVERLPAGAVRVALASLLTLGHGKRRERQESVALHLNDYREPSAGRALMRQMRSLDPRDTLAVQEALPHLKIPARVIWGMRDRFQKPHYGRRLAHDLGTVLQEIEDGKHFVPEDHPDIVAATLNDLLREVESEAEHRVGISP